MAAKVVTVTPGLVWEIPEVERLWFFPEGSEYLRYSPHFHVITRGGFRQNFPLTHMFVVVIDGKLSVKNFYGGTMQRITVSDHVWYVRGTDCQRRAKRVYAMTIPGREAYVRSGR
jgi:hypothetical protein